MECLTKIYARLLNSAMQQHLVQSTYWHDPLNEEKYRQGSTFLADINNEREVNRTYIENLQRLKKYFPTHKLDCHCLLMNNMIDCIPD